MNPLLRQRIYRLSRDRDFLFRASLGIMAISCALGWLVSILVAPDDKQSMLLVADGDSEKLAEIINQKRNLDASQVATWIRQADRVMLSLLLQKSQVLPVDGLPGDDEATNLQSPLPMLEKLIAEAAKVDTSERMLLLNLARGLYADEAGAGEAMANLRQSSAMEPPVRFANEFYADTLMKSTPDDNSEALKLYRREAALFDDAEHARQQVVKILIATEDKQGLREIAEDPKYQKILSAHTQMRIATILRDWIGLARAVIQFDLEILSPGRFSLSLFVASIWLIIVGQLAGFDKRKLILYGCALILGILSASATLFVIAIQEDIRGFTQEGDVWHQLIYCIAGIGFREEALKLMFFLPLIPFLKRRPEIDGLVTAAFVGLGFALQENIGYYLGRDFTAWGRFFTANFFHLAVTGILGLALMRFIRWPRTRWEEFLATFIAAVVVHGLYDAFIMIPELSLDFSIFTLLILAVIAYRFFDQAEHLAHAGRNHTLSPLGVFILGSALLGGTIMITSCWDSPFRLALMSFLSSGLGIFPVVFIFINRFRDA